MKKQILVLLFLGCLFGSQIISASAVNQFEVDLTNYYNQDGFSYDTKRSDGDYDNNKYTYPAELVNINPSYDNVIYQLGPMIDGAKNTVAATGQTISLPQGFYSSIRFLSSATNGDKTGTFRIIYADNTYSDTSLTIRDWCYEPDGHRVVQTMPHRHYPDGDRNGPNDTCRIFAYYLTPAPGKTVTGLKLPNNQDIHILAITLFFTIEDTVPPTTSHNYQYDGKWVNSPVQIQLTATDSDSGVKLVYYKLNDEAAVAGDVINIDNEGITTVQYWAVDNAGNIETNKTIEVKIDRTAPILTAAFSPSPNSKGWHNADVIVKFSATDALSGVASVSQPVTVTTEGYHQAISGAALDNAGNQAETMVTVNLDKTAPVINILYPANGSVINQAQPVITAQISDNLSGIDAGTLKLTIDGNPVTSGIHFSGNQLTYIPAGLSDGNHMVRIEADDKAGNSAIPTGTSFKIDASLPDLPPDPGAVAPELDSNIVTDLKTATGFLYTGENPIQSGVDAETIEVRRAAVIRGKVLDTIGNPLSGVKITILNHSEYGHTYSRSDGMFDMAVNGGGYLTVNYEKAGYPSAQRQVKTTWQDYVWADEVRLVPYDTKVTSIVQNSADGQLAQGSVVRDDRGERQATLFFPAGTTISGGSGGTVSVRATEFTVGSDGPQKMPAVLPPASAYTYCVDLSVDGADSVQFNKPIYFYVDNFLNFPVGGNVPTGYYDTDKGVWVPSDNGVIIRIVSVTDGLANIDVAGNGVAADADTLAGLGFSDAERRKLAETYSAGKTLWRVPIRHFSSWDCNWGWGPPADAIAPNGGAPTGIQDCPSPHACYIERETQVVRENVAISGTLFTLNYSSDRVPGRIANRTLEIPLSGATVPASLKRIVLDITIAGQHYSQSFSNTANQKIYFSWDGKDGYGRIAPGRREAIVKIAYVYDGSYQKVERFGYSGNGTNISGDWASLETTLWQSYTLLLESCPDNAKIVDGWSLNNHHYYDSIGKVLYQGNGSKRSAESISAVITTVVGTGEKGYSGDGDPATQAMLQYPDGIAIGPDGSIYIADSGNNRIRRVGADGIITTIAGTGGRGFSGDGGLATQAMLQCPCGVAIGLDGSIYIADTYNNRIRRVGPDGIINTIAGGGNDGDGVPATQASLNGPMEVAVGIDGSIYIVDYFNQLIRYIGPDCIITTVAGQGTSYVDGVPATQSCLTWPNEIAIGLDGVYIADTCKVSHIGLDGIINTIAGGKAVGFGGDGGLAIDARLTIPYGLAVGADGSIYIADKDNNRIRRVGPDGIITTIGGGGNGGDGVPAIQAYLPLPQELAIGPDGSTYIVSYGNQIRRIGSVLSGFSNSECAIASEDGTELYQFDANGRHLKTLDAATGKGIYTFDYDTDGKLTGITDRDGNVTTITRSGNQTVITAPFGQQTIITANSDGYMQTITNPANETRSFTYGDGGLLTGIADPKGQSYQFTYDSMGRAVRQQNPDGGSITLERSNLELGYQVKTTATQDDSNSCVTIYSVETLTTGETRMKTVKDGVTLETKMINTAAGTETTTLADGTVTKITKGPDPHFGVFGMQAPIITAMTVTTPAGLTYSMTGKRAVTLSDPNNPFSLQTQTDTVTVNGKTSTSVYEVAAKTVTATSPAGRKTVTTLDDKGRVIKVAVTGLAPVTFGYDSYGRLTGITSSNGTTTRTSTIQYNSQGYAASTTDPLSRATRFTYDAAGRVTHQILPDGQQIYFRYDANGNVTALTPPGKPDHQFSYTAMDQEETYTPPDIGAGNNITQYSYNQAQQPALITRPDGQTVGFAYDTQGRLLKVILPNDETLKYGYDAATGNLTGLTAADGGKLSFDYNGSLPTKTAWTGTIAGNVGYTYNNDFLVTAQTVNGANSVIYTYDNDGLLTGAGSLSIARNADNGLLTGTTLGNVTDSITYNGFGEATKYQAQVGGSTVFDSQYTYDSLGRITTKTEVVGSESHTYQYDYDSVGQLTNVYKDSSLYSHYEYDANGNRVVYSGGNGTTGGTYDDQDRLTQYGTNSYAYTANGELQTKTASNGTTNYGYDALGNLKTVKLPDGTRIEYLVDGANRRIGRKANGVLQKGFLYQDGLNPVAELDNSNNVVSRFVYGTRANVPDYMIKDGVIYRIISDHLGSVRLVINASTGDIAQKMDYNEFGKVLRDSNPGFQPFGYAGGLYDKDTGLVRFGARDYDPEVGRWTGKDPIGFGGGDTELYGYCGNDPVNYIDSSGCIAPFLVTGTIGAGAGAIGNTISQVIRNRGFSNFDWRELGVATGTGFVAGMAAPLVAGSYAGSALLGAEANMVQTGLTSAVKGDCPPTTKDYLKSGIAGAIGGGIAGPISKATSGFSTSSQWLNQSTVRSLNNQAFIGANAGISNIGRNVLSGIFTNWSW